MTFLSIIDTFFSWAVPAGILGLVMFMMFCFLRKSHISILELQGYGVFILGMMKG